MTTPTSDSRLFRMPAEWEPQRAVWMLWPYRTDNWRTQALPAEQAFAAVAEAISRKTPVFMGVPEACMETAQQVMPRHITLVSMESDDAWCRDTGPTIVIDEKGQHKAIDWQFNAWGGLEGGLYDNWEKDSRVAAQIAEYLHFPVEKVDIVLEGGSIHVDGEGTLITTEECLLNANRNPHLDRREIEQVLRTRLGVDTIIWLPFGTYNDETDGHIDNLCCFVRPGEVALHWTDDPDDPQYERSCAALKILEQQTDAKGRTLKVWKLPQPGPLYMTEEEAADIEAGAAIPRVAGERLAGSYVNFLISNGQILFPLLDEKTDAEALRIFKTIFPGDNVIGIPAREILLGGGNIHCITQQIPK